MNSFADIASALSEGVSQLEHGQWVSIPLEEQRELRLLRGTSHSGITVVLAQRPVPRNTAEEDAALMALLRLGADTRWTEGFTGGIDENGWDCISLVSEDLTDPDDVEALLHRMMERLSSIPSQVPATGEARWARGFA